MRKVKWGVLGTAGILGAAGIGMQRAKHCEMTAIAGRNADKVEEYRVKYGFQKGYTSYDELLADPEIEAVYIPLPNTLHKEWTEKAILAGKHVLCEKPMVATEEEATALHRLADEKGVFLLEAFAYLHSPVMIALRKMVECGAVGDVRFIDTAFYTSDYDKSNIRMRRETNGGALYDLGVYAVSAIEWIMGCENPVEVAASAVYLPEKVDAQTSGVLTFENGARAAFACGMVLATEKSLRRDRMEIHGTAGSVICHDFEFNKCGPVHLSKIDENGVETEMCIENPDNYGLEVDCLSSCILLKESVAGNDMTREDAIELLRMHDKTIQLTMMRQLTVVNARTMDRILATIGY